MPGELARLEAQATLSFGEERRVLGGLGVTAADPLLEVGGPGAVTRRLHAALPGLRLVGVDRDASLLGHAAAAGVPLVATGALSLEELALAADGWRRFRGRAGAAAWDLARLDRSYRAHAQTLRRALEQDPPPVAGAASLRRLAQLVTVAYAESGRAIGLPPELLPARWALPELDEALQEVTGRYAPAMAAYIGGLVDQRGAHLTRAWGPRSGPEGGPGTRPGTRR